MGSVVGSGLKRLLRLKLKLHSRSLLLSLDRRDAVGPRRQPDHRGVGRRTLNLQARVGVLLLVLRLLKLIRLLNRGRLVLLGLRCNNQRPGVIVGGGVQFLRLFQRRLHVGDLLRLLHRRDAVGPEIGRGDRLLRLPLADRVTGRPLRHSGPGRGDIAALLSGERGGVRAVHARQQLGQFLGQQLVGGARRCPVSGQNIDVGRMLGAQRLHLGGRRVGAAQRLGDLTLQPRHQLRVDRPLVERDPGGGGVIVGTGDLPLQRRQVFRQAGGRCGVGGGGDLVLQAQLFGGLPLAKDTVFLGG